MANLMTRDDTLLGVCEGLAREFGIAPNAIRIVLAAGVLLAPVATIALYLVLGAILAMAQLAWPAPAAMPSMPPAPAAAAGNDDGEPLARAA